MDGAYTDPAVRQAISESISQAEADRMRGDKIREELYGVKYATPTPSITVGTQVRLTGVVVTDEPDIDGDYAVAVEGARKSYNKVWFNPTDFRNLEVIRQPFKRGEVVYSKISATNEEPYVVLNDESLEMVDVTCCRTGFYIANDNPEAYERRP